MATTWKAPTWRMPNEKNQSKFESYSLSLDGSNEYADLNSGVSMVLLPTNEPRPTSGGNVTLAISPKSYSCWFKVDTTGTKTIFSSAPTGGGYHVKLDVNSSNLLEFSLRTPSPTYTNTTGTTTIATDTWYHVLITVDGTNNKLYVNGTLEGTTACSGNMIYYRHTSSSNPKNLIGGYWTTSSTQDFDGSISDLVVFNYALSESQIASLYNSGSPINPMTLKPAPIAYYPLGGNASTGGDSTNTLSVPNVAVPDASVFDFNGSSDFIDLGTTTDYNNGDLTAAIWVNASSSRSSTVYAFSNSGSPSIPGFDIKVKTNNEVQVSRVTDSQNTASGWLNIGFVEDAWQHLAFTYNESTNSLKLFLNGVLKDTSTDTPHTPKTSTVKLTIGSYKGIMEFWEGQLSNAQIWNTTLLDTEIETLYNNGQPLLTGTQPQEANLKAWYKLDQSANWEADAASTWQIPDNRSAYPQSFDFNGTSDIINSSTIDLGTTHTISMWVKITATSFANIITGTGGSQIKLNAPNKIYYYTNNYTNSQPSISMPLNQWNNIVIVRETTTIKFYVNNSLLHTTTSFAGDDFSFNKILGLDVNNQTSNIQLWDSALPATGTDSVETLYNNGSPLTTAIATDNLKAWYKLDNTDKWNSTISNWSIYNNKYPIPTPTYTSAVRYNTGYYNLPGRYAGIGFTDTAFSGSHVSISVWYRWPEGYTSGSLEFMNTGSDPYIVFDGGSSGRRLFVGKYGQKYKNFTTDITDGNWHHYLLYFENTATIARSSMRLWQDGIEIIGSDAGSGSEPSALTIARGIGSANLGGGGVRPTFNVSNFALFNTDQTGNLSTLYNGGTPGDISSLNPLVWYKADSANVQLQSPGVNDVTFTDSSGNNNTGTGPFDNTPPPEVIVETTNVIAREAGTSSGMTEQNLVNNNVSVLNGESSGMDTSNLVTSTLTRQVPYNSYSLNFDSGSSDYIDCGDADVFSFGDSTSDSPFSISAWINFDDVSGNRGIISKYGSSGEEWMMYVAGSNIRLLVKDDSVNKSCYAAGGTTLQTGQWYNFLATYDGRGGATAGDGIKIYINGVEETLTVTNNASYVAMENTTQPVEIGRFSTSYMDGKQSNISIFNEELTSTEVLKIYNSGVPGDLSSFNPNPIAWWSLGSDSYFNGSNWICPDLVGSNNGTSSNMDDDALIGDAPNSTANGTSTNMAIDANLTGNAPNSSNNSFSVNMDYTDRETSVPS